MESDTKMESDTYKQNIDNVLKACDNAQNDFKTSKISNTLVFYVNGKEVSIYIIF